jgi:hypothetical protein
MSVKVYVRHGGHSGASTSDYSSKVRLFDDVNPEITAASAYGQGTGAQGDVTFVDDDGTVEIYEHNRVTITEDASGDELWLQRGPIVRIEGARGPGTKVAAGREQHAVMGDQNSELHGLALREDWDRPAETATERAIAAIEEFCQTDPRLTTDIVAKRWDDGDDPHLVKPNPADGEVEMPAHTYEMGTQLTEILRECSETEGQNWGIVLHDLDGETHNCFQWQEEDDFFRMSTLSISDVRSEVDDDTVFAPWWNQGPAIQRGGADPVLSTVITEYGDQRGHILAENTDVIEKHDYYAEKMTDATTQTEAGATGRAPHLLAGRSREDVTHQPSILVPASKAHLVRAGMGISIKSAAARYEEDYGDAVTRMVAQVKVTPYSPKKPGAERMYILALSLARPKKIAKTRRPVAVPKAPTPTVPPGDGTLVTGVLYPTEDDMGIGLQTSDAASTWDGVSFPPDIKQLNPVPQSTYDEGGSGYVWSGVNVAASQRCLGFFGIALNGVAGLLGAVQQGAEWESPVKGKSRHGVGIDESTQNNRTEWCARIWRSGTGFIGTLWDVGDFTGSNPFPAASTMQSRTFRATSAAVATAVGTDILVIEYGHHHATPTSGGTGGNLRYNDSASVDLPTTEGSTADARSWLGFSFVDAGTADPGSVGDGNEDLLGDDSDIHANADHEHEVRRERMPTVNDDISQGFRVGDRWMHVDDEDDPDEVFSTSVLLDNTDGAAVWVLDGPNPHGHGEISNLLTWINTDSYGAVEDGSTDNLTAFTEAVNDYNASGGRLYIPGRGGSYLVSGALPAITAPGTVFGDGMAGSDAETDGATKLITDSGSAALFTIDSHGVTMRDLALVNNAGVQPSAGGGIVVTSGDLNRYERLSVKGFYINLDIQDGYGWTVDQSYFLGPAEYGIKIRHVDLPDGGDWAIDNSWIYSADYDATAGIRIESGGGGKITNTKVNAYLSLTNQFTNGIDVAVTNGISTILLLVTNCSFENMSGHGISIVSAGTGRWREIVIAGNQFGLWSNSSGKAISVTPTNTDDVEDIIIANNVFQTDGTARSAIQLTNTDNVNLLGNLATGNFTSLYSQSGSTNIREIGASDHGVLSGLADDDHTQYLNETRHDLLDHDGLPGVGGGGAGLLTVDPGTVTYDHSGDDVIVEVSALWGVDGDGPYYDDAGVLTGEEAVLALDPATSELLLVPYNL